MLFGLPMLGESVTASPFKGSAKSLKHELYQVKNALSSCSFELGACVKYFNEDEDEVEYVGFFAFCLLALCFVELMIAQ